MLSKTPVSLLTLIFLFLRSYSLQQCMQDIMDGYFPSELQTRYPGGVPFEVLA